MLEKIHPHAIIDKVTGHHDVIKPLTGLEDQVFSLPDVDVEGNEIGTHHDDWVITNERFHDSGDITVDVARYKEDGTVDEWHGIPADRFIDYQKDVERERKEKVIELELGVSAVRASLVNMVRSSDALQDQRQTETPVWRDIAKSRFKRNERMRQVTQRTK